MRCNVFRAVGTGVVVILVAAGAPGVASGEDERGRRAASKPPKVQVAPSVPGKEFVPRTDAPPRTSSYRPTDTRFPAASEETEVVVPGGSRLAQLPGTVVSVGAPSGGAARLAPTRARVRVLGERARERAGILGVLIRLDADPVLPESSDAGTSTSEGAGDANATKQASSESQLLKVRIDYGSFSEAVGGDWAARLRLVAMPTCAIAEERVAREACADPVELQTANDPRARTLTALAPTQIDGEPAMVATLAGAASDQGDFAATPLAPASSWSTSLQTGNFSWSYPIPTTPVAGDLAPNLAVSYSSQSVDGRTQASNNQTSWLGEGQDLVSGFIERNYASCKDVAGAAGADTDLCWKTDNAVLTFGGQSSELLYNSETDEWRAKNDEGWRIRRSDARAAHPGWDLPDTDNGDNNSEYWELTDQDGTRYYFGREKRYADDGANTGSAWTVPVFGGPDAGCSDADGCQQGWRWNLDYVVDVHGNSMSYFYAQEHNKYGANNNTSQPTYVRGGYLTRIDYGQVTRTEHKTSPAASIEFEVKERCITTAINCETATLNAENAKHWPDVPFDQICDDQASCSDSKSPTFFSRKRLVGITTKYNTGAGFAEADRVSFAQKFPGAGDGTGASLWLESITRTGKDGTDLPLPAIEFVGTQMPNRVLTDGAAPLIKWRVREIKTETGARISVTYSGVDCADGDLPSAPHTNQRRCFPVYWQPNEFSEPQRHWFHKYVVTRVEEDDYAGTISQPVVTTYSYLNGGAWHYDDNPLVKPKFRTYGEWRGYENVEVRKGNAAELDLTPSFDRYTFFRGMNGDRLPDGPDPGDDPDARSVTVTNDDGGSLPDNNRYSGHLYEHVQRDGAGGAITSAEVHVPWLSAKTAGTDANPARIMRAEYTHVRKAKVGTTNFARSTVHTNYDGYGLPVSVHDAGDDALGGDSACAKSSYGRDVSRWLLTPVEQMSTFASNCDSTSRSDLLSDQRYYFDANTFGATPEQGDVTKVETDSGTQAAAAWRVTQESQYDARGRQFSVTDGEGNTTTTAYVPSGVAGDGPLTRTVVTDAKGFETTTDYTMARGMVRRVADPNQKVTSATYDALGRLAAVWEPGRVQGTDDPDVRFGYGVKNTTYSHRTTYELEHDGSGYIASYEIFDAMLRPVETQAPSGDLDVTERVLTTTKYNSRGQVSLELGPYAVRGTSPTFSYYDPVVPAVLDNHRYIYDGAGRPTADVYQPKAVEKWRTTTTYDANKVKVDPPVGGTPTTQIADARGNVTAHVDHLGTTPSATGQWTNYTYDAVGRMLSITDPQANVWRWTYDLRGNQITARDPDKGNATMVYDNNDRLVTTTDARGKATHTTYDELGRKTALYDGTTVNAAKKRSEWTYDPAGAKGLPAKSTRYSTPGDPSTAYVTAITGYNDDYQPLGHTLTVPEIAGETKTPEGASLAGTYTTTLSYYDDGNLYQKGFPSVPGLVNDKVYYEYDRLGQPTVMGGASSLVHDTAYSPYGDLLQIMQGTTSGKYGIQTWFYDEGTRRLSRHIVSNQAVADYITDANYSYDASGNVLKIADTAASGTDVQCFLYDYLRQVKDAWTIPVGDYCGTTAPTSTNYSSMVGGNAAYWSDYTYDKIGNRTSETERTKSGTTWTTATNAYTYPASGATAIPANGQGGPHAVSTLTRTVNGATTNTAYKYDNAGNMTTRGGQELSWDSEGELSTVDTTPAADGGENTNVYDADGNRVIRKDPDGSLTLYLDGAEVRATGATKTSQRWYEFGGYTIATHVEASFHQEGMHMLAADHHGTGQVQMNAWSGAWTKRRFDPFGAARSGIRTPDWKGDHTFLDKPLDDTSLVQIGARYYDRTLGRFISVDPLLIVDDPTQANAYAYAKNNPATFSDPTGLYCDTACGGGTGADPNPDDNGNSGGGGGDGAGGSGSGGSDDGGYSTNAGSSSNYSGAAPVRARVGPAYPLAVVSGLRTKPGDLGPGGPAPSWYVRPGNSGRSNSRSSNNIIGRAVADPGSVAQQFKQVARQTRTNRASTPVDKGRRLARGLVAAFDKAGVKYTQHFATRIAQRGARGVSGRKALDAYNSGTRFYDPATRAHIRYDRRTGVTVVLRKGRAHTVYQQPRPSSRWRPEPFGGD